MIVLTAAGWMMAVSFVTLAISLLLLPWLLARLPADYFVTVTVKSLIRTQHPVIYWTTRSLKNVIGGVLVAAGLIMLVTPGQGVLTLLVGLLLMEFPGKRQLELRLIRRPRVLATINAMRHKFRQPPLQIPK